MLSATGSGGVRLGPIQPAPPLDFWPLESRHRHFPNPNPNPYLQNTLEKTLMPMTHLLETRAEFQRRKAALDSSAAFRRELQQNLR